jgi:DHA1 family inner membrane transport protein
MDRKLQVILLLGLFVLGNLICAVAPSYGMLFVGRVVSEFSHGAFYGVASVVATILVPAEGRARSLALVSVGVMVANVVGVPLGTALGQAAGWRTAFWGVCGLGAISAIALLACLPNKLGANSGNVLSQLRAVGRPAVLIGLLLSACFTVGLFVCFSYVTPLLTTVSGATPEQIPLLLVLFGAGATVGVLGDGRLASNGLATTIAAAFVAQILVYAAIVFLCWSLVAMTVLMFMLGLAGMLTVAPLRMLVINAAIDAPGLASTLTSSTFNLGVAIGAAIGAVLLQLGVGYAHLPIVGICFALGGLALVRVARLATSP